ncbi:hypothetical protein LTR16_003931 [Cryomyces antarcticus]|uniref:BZIP domain-containing protein n=1 Tax=Cryomyces antarcticus TaxID=329879 RepID=A0ABR0LNH4_9PEZI|nr:hypothetical protein LTR39_003239 [Cryomyces antarcticus]KAK5019440.1 hypothetical protein LTR60_001117 [Cryomyces antarcticus]KAK5201075.1 hypothetical protein LTR16_003931 [Cryomyces antarcticus]
MDYSYFNVGNATQPYHFNGLPPTPGYGPQGGDDTNDSSPVGSSQDHLFQAFRTHLTGNVSQDRFDPSNFLTDPSNFTTTFDPSISLVTTPPPAMNAGSPIMVGSMDSGIGDIAMDDRRGNGERVGSSEEKENLSPAQSRRKAQNRAAQRAFRERKEKHVHELETRLESLATQSQTLRTDNERLKLALRKAETENEILRATSATAMHELPLSPILDRVDHPDFSASAPYRQDSVPTTTTTTMAGRIVATDGSIVHTPSTSGILNVAMAQPGLLHPTQTWDLILVHPLFQAGKVDIGDVCERLRTKAQCDGLGPVFCEADVRKAVEDAAKGGGDLLV